MRLLAVLPRLLPEPGPVRALALVTLVNTTGNGIFFTLSALYFTRIVGLSIAEVGIGLGVAAVFGLLAGVPLGHLGDRRGPREVLALLLALMSVLSVTLLNVSTFGQFVVAMSVLMFVDTGANAVRNGLIASVVSGSARATTKAYLRSITNVGITLGTAIAAVALYADTRASYLAVLFVDVATWALSAALVLRVPHVPPQPAEERASMFLALRDVPFVAMTLVTALLAMHYSILELAMPLWVVEHTAAPRWLVSPLLMVNTVVVVACQVLVARRVVTVTAAVRASVLSGVLLLAACVVFGASGEAAVRAAVALLLLGTLLQVAAELWQASASFLLGFELAADHAQGAYQGLYGMSFGISAVLAPPVMAFLPLGMGVVGWWLLGLVLLVAALLTVPVVGWCVRTRPKYVERPAGSVAFQSPGD
jgi:MFS family permease